MNPKKCKPIQLYVDDFIMFLNIYSDVGDGTGSLHGTLFA